MVVVEAGVVVVANDESEVEREDPEWW